VIVRELATTALVALGATLVMFTVLDRVAPDPARPLSPRSGVADFLARYLAWAWDAVRFEFGESPYTHRSVEDLVRTAAPRTLGLLGLGIGVSLVVHGFLGLRGRLARSAAAASLAHVVSLVSLVPVYILAFVLRAGPGGAFQRVDAAMSGGERVLFVVTLAALLLLSNGLFTESAGTVKTALEHEASEPYVRSLIARGIRPERTMFRNVAGVLLGAFAGQLPRLVTSVFLLEWAFNIHGVGYEAIRAFDYEGRRDVPVILAMTFLGVLFVRGLVLFERLSVSWITPRVRLER
jgi:peptide/nickel transport system permease protein